MKSLEFYTLQSVMTDPRNFSYLFHDIPKDVCFIKALLQDIILHFWDGKMHDYSIPFKRVFDIETRYVEKMLEKIIALDNSSLKNFRHLDRRIVGSCRDYAVLFCSILRYHGIPVRTRVAFSAYYFKEYNHDEVVLEYWNKDKNKWCVIDPRVTEPHIVKQKLTIDFDLFDVPPDKLIVAGNAWKIIRENPELAIKFCGGDVRKNRGMLYVRDRLIQDIAALNSVEMQLWDLWGLMLKTHSIEEDDDQLAYLDQLANFSTNPDDNFEALRDIYQNDSNIKVPEKIVSVSPVYRKKEITLVL